LIDKKRVINFYIKHGINKVNSSLDVVRILKKYTGEEKRTLALEIRDIENANFGVSPYGKLVRLNDLKNPTVKFIISEDSFIQMVKRKITFDDVIYLKPSTDILGDWVIRDISVFRLIFNNFGDNILEDL